VYPIRPGLPINQPEVLLKSGLRTACIKQPSRFHRSSQPSFLSLQDGSVGALIPESGSGPYQQSPLPRQSRPFFIVSRCASAIANPQSRYSLAFVGALAFLDHFTYISYFSSSSVENSSSSIPIPQQHQNQDDILYLQ
jgi:hypothetical protein